MPFTFGRMVFLSTPVFVGAQGFKFLYFQVFSLGIISLYRSVLLVTGFNTFLLSKFIKMIRLLYMNSMIFA
jgi:hypothetical protein